MFCIKICGITNKADALAATQAGADAVGFNFFAKSKRFVEPGLAHEIVASLPKAVHKIGVFVNHSAAEISSVAAEVGLDGIQLHGDEPASIVAQLPAVKFLVRAFRCGNAGLEPLKKFLDDCRVAGRVPDAVLIDADAGAEFGGTGQPADWQRIKAERHLLGGVPLILAGGLTPTNVAAAIAAVRPDGVDVASGVERGPGLKDNRLVADFIAAAKQAFREAEPTRRVGTAHH